MNWETGTGLYTLLCILQITSENLPWGARSSARCSLGTWEGNPKKRGYMCTGWGGCFPGGANCKDFTCQCRSRRRHVFDPWVGKISWKRAWQPTPVSLPGESHGRRSLVDYSPRGHKEWDMTEQQNNEQQYVCVWAIHSAVQQKLTHYKATILQ